MYSINVQVLRAKKQVVMKLALKVFVLVQKLEHTSVSVFGFAYVAICLIGSGVVGGGGGGGGMEMKMEFRQLREAMDHIQEKADRYGLKLMRSRFKQHFPLLSKSFYEARSCFEGE